MLEIPSYVKTAINCLEKAGFEAYAVGGCVRDSLLGKAPSDWDMCTNALPDEVCEVFKDYHVIETGLKHGTVTVRISHNPVEITTYRTDGEYSGHRRPESVTFVSDLKEDLSRRDFTVNALAYSEKDGIIDLFGGRNDLESGIIRCVGNPCKRFDEDALRILRALRFSSVLGFEIEESTKKAIHEMKGLLKDISAERIREELLKILCGKDAVRILKDYSDVVFEIIPELSKTVGFEQKTPHHVFDVYEHIVNSVGNIEARADLRLVMLLHDIGKPQTFSVDENGIGHFKLHPTESSGMANEILRRLKFDNKTRNYVCEQIYQHDNRFSADRKSVRRFVAKHGAEFMADHLKIQRADILSQSEYLREKKLRAVSLKEKLLAELMAEKETLQRRDLKINGRILMQNGFKEGRDLKTILDFCLEGVVEERVANEENALLRYACENFSHLKEKNL